MFCLISSAFRRKVCKSIHLDPTVDGGIIETDDNNTEYSNQGDYNNVFYY